MGDGLCFPKSIQKAIKLDYGLDWPLDAIKHDIMTEVTKNAKSYMHFYDMIEHKVVTSTYDYLEKGQFTDSVVNVVVPATAQALRINLFIYCRHSQHILLIPAMCRGSTMDVYLKYNRSWGTYYGGDHYTPLVKKQGVSKNGTPKIPITSVLTPASIQANVVSSTLFGTSQQTIPSYFTLPISVPSGVLEFICPSGVKVNLPSSQDLNSLPGNVSGMGPNNTNFNCGGGSIYNSPCSFLTSNQKCSD